jgi:hypothetical protein
MWDNMWYALARRLPRVRAFNPLRGTRSLISTITSSTAYHYGFSPRLFYGAHVIGKYIFHPPYRRPRVTVNFRSWTTGTCAKPAADSEDDASGLGSCAHTALERYHVTFSTLLPSLRLVQRSAEQRHGICRPTLAYTSSSKFFKQNQQFNNPYSLYFRYFVPPPHPPGPRTLRIVFYGYLPDCVARSCSSDAPTRRAFPRCQPIWRGGVSIAISELAMTYEVSCWDEIF